MNFSAAIFWDMLAGWLMDYFLLATVLLGVAFIALRLVRQPKRRLVIAWVVLGELTALAVVCALPSWPRMSLLPVSASAQVGTISVEPAAPARVDAKAGRPASSPGGMPLVHESQAAVSGAASTLKLPPLSVMLGIGYLMGMTATGLWLLWGAIGAMRLCRRATTATGPLCGELEQLVGGARRPRLLLSRQVCNAAAVGILRPTILLQTELAERESPQALRAMLAHEWGHIRNHDLWLLALERCLRLLLFAHPLYWRLRGQIRGDQEAVADAFAASERRHEYAQDLLAWARLTVDRKLTRAIAVVGILESSTQLSRRITMLLDETFCVQTTVSREWKYRALGAFVLLGAALSLVTLQPGCSLSGAGGGSAKLTESAAPGTMMVKVVDEEGRPVEGAKIHAGVWTKETFKPNRDYATDAAGQGAVELPKSLYILRIFTSKEGRVPMFTHWEQEWFAGHGAPGEVTITLKKGTTIGGVVKNEEGEPIAGAKVGVQVQQNGAETQMMVDPWLAEGEDARVTDAKGQWTLDNVPGVDLALLMSVTHPDYVSDLSWGGLQRSQNVTMAALRAQKATIVMQHGTSLTGVVTDPQGKGIAGAVVVWGDDPYGDSGMHQEHMQEVRTDASGVYRLPPMQPMAMTVTAVAEGWMPDLKKTTIARENSKLDFQLKRGNNLLLRFVDSVGKPIPEVAVEIQGWRGCKSLYNVKHPIVLETQIPRLAGKDGVYEWAWAPDDAVQYQFYKEGYKGISKSIVAGDVERVIQLDR